MKYAETQITFAEVPDEISLTISISECPNKCKGCHSAHLQQSIGTILDSDTLDKLIDNRRGITCVCLMGGDRDPKEINYLCKHIKSKGLKSAWYSGEDKISPEIDIRNFDYIKIGPYIEESGPINKEGTNQIMYQIDHFLNENEESFELNDITYKFIK